MLTALQHKTLSLIHKQVCKTGIPPTVRELCTKLDRKGLGGMHRVLSALEERGFIRRLPRRARAIEIIKLPENIEKTAGFPLPNKARRVR
jgi:repressor LexA